MPTGSMTTTDARNDSINSGIREGKNSVSLKKRRKLRFQRGILKTFSTPRLRRIAPFILPLDIPLLLLSPLPLCFHSVPRVSLSLGLWERGRMQSGIINEGEIFPWNIRLTSPLCQGVRSRRRRKRARRLLSMTIHPWRVTFGVGELVADRPARSSCVIVERETMFNDQPINVDKRTRGEISGIFQPLPLPPSPWSLPPELSGVPALLNLSNVSIDSLRSLTPPIISR